MRNKTDDPFAKAEKLRVAKTESARAMEDAEKNAIAVRKNMARLRELRLAKEAQAIREQISNGGSASKPKSKKRFK
jgi:guanyl-specific ribonuclease Sa